jgi:hypothetical protein
MRVVETRLGLRRDPGAQARTRPRRCFCASIAVLERQQANRISADERGRHALGLHHRGRGHRRLPDGQPAQRRPQQARAAGRGRWRRRLPLDPHPGGLPVLHRQPAHRLAVQHRGRPGPERPLAALPARQGAGRLFQHQRHDLHARPVARLRPVGRPGGDARWRWDFCVPYFKRHEDHWRGPDQLHGAPGFDPRAAARAASGASSASA